MKEKHNGKLKILIAFGILFLVVSVILALIFLDSKKSYTVKFDLNGGTLLGGSLEQHVLQGQDAIPPSVVKDGAYLRGWSTSHRRITKDVVIKAIWEYETTVGIVYTDGKNQNFVEIERAYPYLRGEVYLGAYFNEKKILGILDGAFKDCEGITRVYLLNGLIRIGDSAFENCTSLTQIEIPETVTHLGKNAFKNCNSLESLTLNEGLLSIGENAFEGCEKLVEIFIPESVTTIEAGAFAGCKNLVIKIAIPEHKLPEGWADGWNGDATIEYIKTESEEDSTKNEETTSTEEDSSTGEETTIDTEQTDTESSSAADGEE